MRNSNKAKQNVVYTVSKDMAVSRMKVRHHQQHDKGDLCRSIELCPLANKPWGSTETLDISTSIYITILKRKMFTKILTFLSIFAYEALLLLSPLTMFSFQLSCGKIMN